MNANKKPAACGNVRIYIPYTIHARYFLGSVPLIGRHTYLSKFALSLGTQSSIGCIALEFKKHQWSRSIFGRFFVFFVIRNLGFRFTEVASDENQTHFVPAENEQQRSFQHSKPRQMPFLIHFCTGFVLVGTGKISTASEDRK